MQQRILQKHHQGSCLEYEIDNLYDSHLEGRHIFLSLHALMFVVSITCLSIDFEISSTVFSFPVDKSSARKESITIGKLCRNTNCKAKTISPHEK